MEATDFRIGNLLIEENTGEVIKVLKLLENEIHLSGNFKGKWRAIPIQLTDYFVSLVDMTDVDFLLEKTGSGYLVINIERTYIIAEIKYFHQLQNLYFALTGKELTLKK